MTSPIRNPYLDPTGGPARTKSSVVCVLDLLGFVSEMKAAYENGAADKLLVRLREALSVAGKEFNEDIPGVTNTTWSWHVKMYTDNVVVGSPIIFSDAEGELGNLMLVLRYFQLDMASRGFFLRGGIAIGQLYMDDEIVFGDGLAEAYRVESSLARDPRITLSESFTPYVKRHLGFYRKPAESPHNQVLLRDADGQLFVNYLGAAFDDYPENPDFSLISAHREAVTTKLEQYKTAPPIWGKYAWVANYHNFICDERGGEFLQYKIDPSILRLMPSRLVK